jgi:hypothetical protein
MKKVLFILLGIASLLGCSKSPGDKITGTWVSFDQYNGLKEITFSGESFKIKQFLYGEDTDIEIIRKYKIVDDIIFVKNTNTEEYYYDCPYYNYAVNGAKLFLSGYFGMEVFTRRTERNMTETRKNLMGNWLLAMGDKKIELSFDENNVAIVQYDKNGNIIKENTIAYQLDEHYLKIENLEDSIGDFYFYDNLCLYSISKDALCLLTCVTGSRGDAMVTEPLCFEKQ